MHRFRAFFGLIFQRSHYILFNLTINVGQMWILHSPLDVRDSSFSFPGGHLYINLSYCGSTAAFKNHHIVELHIMQEYALNSVPIKEIW